MRREASQWHCSRPKGRVQAALAPLLLTFYVLLNGGVRDKKKN